MRSIKKLKSFVIQKLEKELPPQLSYHGAQHTLHVLEVCNHYLKRYSIRDQEALLIRTAALMHDTGIIVDYANHEEASVQLAWEWLPSWGYTKSDLKRIEGMVMATRIPQRPKNLFEMILCDSDLDYLGTDRFYEIGETLFKELMTFDLVRSEEEWDRLQVKFLNNHRYHTSFAQKYREPVKRRHLREIMDKWGWSEGVIN